MKRAFSCFVLSTLFVLGFVGNLQAETKLSPRALALQEQAATYGDAHPLGRRIEEFRTVFQKQPNPLLDPHARVPVSGPIAAQGIVAIYEIRAAGQMVRLSYDRNKAVNVGGKNLYLLRGMGVTFLMVDGIARFVLASDGREGTISPIITYAQVRTGLSHAPNENRPIPNPIVPFVEQNDEWLQTVLAAGEISMGLTMVLAGNTSGPANGVRRALRAGIPLILIDGVMRLHHAPSREIELFPIVTFARETIARQPIYADLTVGDLTEDMLRRLELVK